jgi:GNAT superfamily N-acetyltransferase
MIRPAALSDVREMNRLRLQVRENVLTDPDRITEAMTADAITASGRGWVFESDGHILGFSIARDEDPSIWALFVRPDCEGSGIGTALHDAAVDWLWSRGARQAWLSTDPDTRAECFYRDRGWRQTGRLANGELRLELRRPLSKTEGIPVEHKS